MTLLQYREPPTTISKKTTTMRDTLKEHGQTILDDINDQYDDYLRVLDHQRLNLKPIIRFDSTAMDDLCDLLKDTNLTLV